MSIFRTLILNSNSEPRESQIIKYKATSKLNVGQVANTKIKTHEYNIETGEGIIICARDIITINNDAFRGHKELTDIIIPEGTVNIGSNAFGECILNSIELPDTLKTINSQYDCKIEKIYVNSIDFWFNVIREEDYYFGGSFYDKYDNKIIEITVPKNINYINAHLFRNIEGVEIINIGDSVSEIRESAFTNCKDLRTVNIENINSISILKNAFSSCINLENLNTSFGINIVGDFVFDSCTKLKNVPLLSNDMSILPKMSFRKCESLENINISDNITKIYQNAFEECINLKYVTLSDNITVVSNGAFQGCINLLKVHFPINCESISNNCFRNCSSLYEININNVTDIGAYAFNGCSNLSNIVFSENLLRIQGSAFSHTNINSVIFPNKLNTVEGSAFYGCKNLINIEFNNKIKTLPAGIFAYCSSLEYVNIPDNITTVTSAFYNCDKLKEVNIGSGVTKIDYNSFTNSGDGDLKINVSEDNNDYCSENGILFNKNKTTLHCYKIDKLQNEYIIPDTVKIIAGAFHGCKYLTNVDLNNVSTIKYYSFKGCAIEELILPNTLTILESSAISNCTNLTNINIPSSITTNVENNFHGCDKLNINVDENKNYCSIDGVLFNKTKTELLSFRKGEIIPNYEIPNIETLTIIGEGAFQDCKNLKTISIPNTINTIKEQAFNNTGLITINLPESITYIGNYCFSGSDLLESIYINSKNLEIEFNNFGCKNLKYLHIKSIEDWIQYNFSYNSTLLSELGLYINNELVTEINLDGDYIITGGAFKYYKYLTKLNLNVTAINQYAFGFCENLIEININCPTISGYAFSDCINLKTLSLGQKSSKIMSHAFLNCESLTKVNVDSLYTWCNLKEIDNYIMNYAKCLYVNNKLLTGTVTIPDGISILPTWLFLNVSFITKIIITEGVTQINDRAFNKCFDLEEIDISNTVTNMNESFIFQDCLKLKTIIIRAKVAPSINNNYTFNGIGFNGILYYPKGSDYSSWLSKSNHTLGYYGWKGVETEFE